MDATQFYGWGQQLLQDLPAYYEDSDFMQQYLMALGFEFEVLDRLTRFFTEPEAQAALANSLPDDLETIIAQWFVRTANDSSLLLWENMLSIPRDVAMGRPDRIAGILTRMQSIQAPTPVFIRDQLLQYADDVAIIEHLDLSTNDINRYSFDVRILHPTGIQDNVVTAIDAMIKRIKPAHLHYMILYSELTWSGIANHTWSQMGNMTWKTLTF